MYNEKFSKLYAEDNYDAFAVSFFHALKKYLEENDININTHLDIACGTGSLCYYINQYISPSQGIDLSPHMIEIAKELHPHIDFKVLDMANFNLNKTFDLVTCTCDSLNHLDNINDVESACTNAYNHLNNEGLFIFDIIDIDSITPNVILVSPRENNVRIEYEFTIGEDSFLVDYIKYKNNELVHKETIKELIINTDIIINMLKKIGFEIILFSNHINEENKKYKNKLYFICKKMI